MYRIASASNSSSISVNLNSSATAPSTLFLLSIMLLTVPEKSAACKGTSNTRPVVPISRISCDCADSTCGARVQRAELGRLYTRGCATSAVLSAALRRRAALSSRFTRSASSHAARFCARCSARSACVASAGIGAAGVAALGGTTAAVLARGISAAVAVACCGSGVSRASRRRRVSVGRKCGLRLASLLTDGRSGGSRVSWGRGAGCANSGSILLLSLYAATSSQMLLRYGRARYLLYSLPSPAHCTLYSISRSPFSRPTNASAVVV